MSLETIANGRVYPRKFDHDEARRRFARGETVYALAKEYGVNYKAVHRIVDANVDRKMRASTRRTYTAKCESCGEECISLRHPAKAKHNPDGRELCHRCRSDERRERLVLNPAGECVAARCLTCREWKHADQFGRGVRHREVREGGIHQQCRDCLTAVRQAYRERHKDPCESCGTLCLPPNEKKTNGSDRPRCRDCFYEDMRKARAAA